MRLFYSLQSFFRLYDINKKEKIVNRVLSLAVAVLINSKAINAILIAATPASEGLLKYVYLFVAFMLIISLFIGGIRKRFACWYPIVFLCLIIGMYFLCETALPTQSSTNLFELTAYCIVPVLLGLGYFDFATFVKGTLSLTSFGILFSYEIFAKSKSLNNISMGISYAFLPAAICATIYLLLLLKHEAMPKTPMEKIKNTWYFICSGTGIYYMIQLVLYGSRGSLLSLLFLLLVLLIGKYDDVCKKYVIKRPILAVFIALTLIFVYIFYKEIIKLVYSLDVSYGWNIRFINKMYKLVQANDLLNGRGEIFQASVNGIISSPFWGNGFDRFEANTGFVYSHNLILQILYDGGFLLFALIIPPVIVNCIKTYKSGSHGDFFILIFFLLSAVLPALFSGNLWKQFDFWFFFSWLICGRRSRNSTQNDMISHTYSVKAVEEVNNLIE